MAPVNSADIAPEAGINVKLYPNPAKDRVTIYTIGGNSKRFMNIYDARGKSVYSQPLNEMFTTLSLQKLGNGVYYVRIVSEKGEMLYNEKLIKN
jgi:myo-inositol-hexaphosphate 3-phosphohydrolase